MTEVYEGTVWINRPPEQVFQFIANYENDPKWRSEVREMLPLDAGEPHVGQKTRERSSVLGQKLETVTVVTELEPGCRVRSETVSGPVPVVSVRTCVPERGGTRFTYRLEGDSSGVWFFRLISKPLAKYYQGRISLYVNTLKEILEKEAVSPS